jgi:hypothetical protein
MSKSGALKIEDQLAQYSEKDWLRKRRSKTIYSSLIKLSYLDTYPPFHKQKVLKI